MRLGLGSYACAWAIGVPGFERPSAPLDAIGLIERAAELGLKLVQIADNLPLERQSAASLAAIRGAAGRAGVAIELGARGIQAEHLRHMLRVCGELDCGLLRVVADTAGQWSPEQMIREIREVLPEFERAHVMLAIENHDLIRAADLAGIVEAAGSPNVGICLDTVNSFGCTEGPDHVIGKLIRHVVSVHVKDFTIRRAPHMMGFEIVGMPAGQGMLDVPGLLSALRAAKRDPNAILELWPSPECDIETTVVKEREWARQSVRYLRTLIPD